MNSKLINILSLPKDLRSLTIEQLQRLSNELRDELIDTVSSSGGHFASSLGATEITVALHHLFNTPEDRLIWDVGHQCYIHKILTGRRKALSTIRQLNGLSGFLRRDESEFDSFGAGHAGTSISAAVGMRVALDKIAPDRYVVAVIGDGSFTAGMALEALNHAGHLGLKKFIVVLNDNEMSISENVGALSRLFSHAVTSKSSSRFRSLFKSLHRQGYIPKLLYKAIDRAEEATQVFFSSPAMLIEGFKFRYIGPIDGHSIPDLVQALTNAKEQDIPVLIHARTVKGKGYEPAEEDPIKWHGVSPFDRQNGVFISTAPQTKSPPSYTSVFTDTFIQLAKTEKRIIGITAAMLGGTGLDKAQKALPAQVFDVGICEQHAVTFAAGLACEGFIPIVAIYSTFLQRAFDQVLHDVCIQKLPVIFAMDRGGLVGNDGETHQGVFDIAYLRSIPNMVLMAPKDENEFRHMLYTATTLNTPVGLRYPRGNGAGVLIDQELQIIPIGKAEVILRGTDILLIAYGTVVQTALKVASTLRDQHGIDITVINARFAKPLDSDLLTTEISNHNLVYTLEDHVTLGGFGSAVLELLNQNGILLSNPIKCFGVPDHFIPHGTQNEQQRICGFDADSIINEILSVVVTAQRSLAI